MNTKPEKITLADADDPARIPEISEIADEPVFATIASVKVDLGFAYVTRADKEGEPTEWNVYFAWASDDPAHSGGFGLGPDRRNPFLQIGHYGTAWSYRAALATAIDAAHDDYPEDGPMVMWGEDKKPE